MTESSEILQILKFDSEITSCDFNSNNLLALGSSDRTLRVMEWKKGLGFVDKCYSPLIPHKYGITSVRFSPQGIILVSSSLDGTASLYDVETGTEIYTVVQPNKCNIRYCEITTDSTKLITASDDGIFCFWDLVNRTKIGSHLLHDGENFSVRGLAVSSDSEYLLSADSNGSLNLWFIGDIKISGPKCLLRKKNLHDGLYCCQFSPITEYTVLIAEEFKIEYFLATCGADNFILIWKLEIIFKNSKPITKPKYLRCELSTVQILKGHVNEVLNIRYDCRGSYLASTGLDDTVKLWEAATGVCLKTFQGHTRFGTSCTFTSDSEILGTGSNDKTVIIWKLNPDLDLDYDLTQHCNIVNHFASMDFIISSNERLNCGEANEMNKKPQILQTLKFSAFVSTVCFHGNYLVAAAGGDKYVNVYMKTCDLNFFKMDNRLEYKYGINYLDISPCGKKLISGSIDGVLIFWDLQMDLKYEMKTENCLNALKVCKFSPDSQLIAVGGDDQAIFLWDAINLEFKKILTTHEEAITSLAFTPDSNCLISACAAGTIKLHDLEKDECSGIVKNAHDLGIMACDFSSTTITLNGGFTGDDHSEKNKFDYYLLATCGKDSLIKLWQVGKGQINMFKTLLGHGGTVNFVKFSSNRPFLLGSCGTDATVRIWEPDSENCLFVLNHQSAVTTCSFSQDLSLIVTGCLNNKISIWSLPKKLPSQPPYVVAGTIKPLPKWSNKEVAQWFEDVGCFKVANWIRLTSLTGSEISVKDMKLILSSIQLDGIKERNTLKILINWLKKDAHKNNREKFEKKKNCPHRFLCPITHEIMSTPVTCTDGYNYERKSIIEWFISGQIISPLTRKPLKDLNFQSNVNLKKNICEFFYGINFND